MPDNPPAPKARRSLLPKITITDLWEHLKYIGIILFFIGGMFSYLAARGVFDPMYEKMNLVSKTHMIQSANFNAVVLCIMSEKFTEAEKQQMTLDWVSGKLCSDSLLGMIVKKYRKE